MAKKIVKVKPEIKTILKRYKRALLQTDLPVEKVILFGSQAIGKAGRWSDIDVCVISPDFGRDEVKEMVRLRNIALPVDIRIEPHPYSIKDFMVEEDPFAYQIRKTGIVI